MKVSAANAEDSETEGRAAKRGCTGLQVCPGIGRLLPLNPTPGRREGQEISVRKMVTHTRMGPEDVALAGELIEARKH